MKQRRQKQNNLKKWNVKESFIDILNTKRDRHMISWSGVPIRSPLGFTSLHSKVAARERVSYLYCSNTWPNAYDGNNEKLANLHLEISTKTAVNPELVAKVHIYITKRYSYSNFNQLDFAFSFIRIHCQSSMSCSLISTMWLSLGASLGNWLTNSAFAPQSHI